MSDGERNRPAPLVNLSPPFVLSEVEGRVASAQFEARTSTSLSANGLFGMRPATEIPFSIDKS